MYYSNSIIKKIQAEKLLALQLEKALSGVKKEALEAASRIQSGATRLLYYTSCFTDNYHEVCSKLKNEDRRFLEGVIKLLQDRKIIHQMFTIYFEELLKHKNRQQLEMILWQLKQLGLNLSISTLTSRSFVLGITSTVCLSIDISSLAISKVRKISGGAVAVANLYGYVQMASESAQRLKMFSPTYYHALYLNKLEMMYFLVEPIFMKAIIHDHLFMSNADIAQTIYKLVR